MLLLGPIVCMDKAKYKAKAKDSFTTKKNLFLFDLAINGLNQFSNDDFIKFEIKSDLVKRYTSEYWQELENYTGINSITIKDIYDKIEKLKKEHLQQFKQLEDNYIINFSKIFPEEEFHQLSQKEECHYCKITTKQIEILGAKHKLNKKSFRGWSLEIDRFDSNLEYKPSNCTMACYWCNNAKTDEFNEKEFLLIAEGISKVWKARLNNDC